MINKNIKKSVVLKSEEFFSGAKDSVLFKEVAAKQVEKATKEICDPVQNKRDRDWNKLCNKIVGSE